MTAFVVDASAFDRSSVSIAAADAVFAPELIDLEVANILRKSILRGVFDTATATSLFADWTRNDVQRVGHAASLELIWALRHTITPYDAAYVALAMQLEIPLITADRRLAAAAATYCEVITLD